MWKFQLFCISIARLSIEIQTFTVEILTLSELATGKIQSRLCICSKIQTKLHICIWFLLILMNRNSLQICKCGLALYCLHMGYLRLLTRGLKLSNLKVRYMDTPLRAITNMKACLPSQRGLLLKEKICSPWEHFLSFKSSPLWEGTHIQLTLVTTAAFVPKDVAIIMNLLL